MLLGTRRALLGGDFELNVTCPAITPTLGAELVTNGNFSAWTGDNPNNWTVTGEVGGDPEITQRGAGQSHASAPAGTGMCNFYSSAGGSIQITQAGLVSVGDWVYLSILVDTVVAGGIKPQVGTYILGAYLTIGSKAATGRAITNGSLAIFRNAGATDVTIDDASFKKITFSSMLSYLGTRSQRNGTYTCHPTVAANTQCGGLLAYADANNFVQWIVDRATGQAQLIKRIAGVYTSVIAGAITYGAAKALKVIVSDTNYSLYYDGVQIGVTTAINDSGLGTAVYGFNTLAGNSVGIVTTSKATS